MNPIKSILYKLMKNSTITYSQTATPVRQLTDGRVRLVEKVDGSRFLHMHVRPGPKGEAVVINADTLLKAGISHLHYDEFGDRDYSLNLQDVFDKDTSTVTFYVRKSPIAVKRLLNLIDTALAKAVPDSEVAKLLREYKSWSIGTGRHAYELLVVTNFSSMVGSDGQLTSALYGRMVNYLEFGPFLRDWLLGFPLDWKNQHEDPFRGKQKPLDYGLPPQLWTYTTYWLSTDSNKAYAAWFGDLTCVEKEVKDGNEVYLEYESNVDQLLLFADYLVIHTELRGAGSDEGEYLFAKVLAIKALPWHEGIIPDFAEVARDFGKIGFNRVTSKTNLKEIQKSIIPGGVSTGLTPRWVPFANEVLEKIASRLVPYSEEKGNLSLGLIRGATPSIVEFIGTHVTVAAIGKTKEAGKSTYMGMLAAVASILANAELDLTPVSIPYLVWMPLSWEHFSSAGRWIKLLGGTLKDLSHLQDAFTIIAGETGGERLITAEEVLEEQLKLHQKDAQEAQQFVEQWFTESVKLGRPALMPFSFECPSVNTRVLHWYIQFLIPFSEAWGELYRRWGVVSILDADNFSDLKRTDSDTNLGDLPFRLGKNLALIYANAVSNWRNKGFLFWSQTHAKTDFELPGHGMYNKYNLALWMSLRKDGKRVARVVSPATEPHQEDDEIFPEVEVQLDGYLKKTFERLEGR